MENLDNISLEELEKRYYDWLSNKEERQRDLYKKFQKSFDNFIFNHEEKFNSSDIIDRFKKEI